MAYEIVFPSKGVENEFEKTLKRIPAHYKKSIIQSIRNLKQNPRPPGKRAKKLKGLVAVSYFIAQFRLRVGPYRVLYDVDDRQKKVVLLKLLKRDEHTYD